MSYRAEDAIEDIRKAVRKDPRLAEWYNRHMRYVVYIVAEAFDKGKRPAASLIAAEWAIEQANHLIRDTHFLPDGKMADDSLGASVSTYGALSALANMDSANLAANPSLLVDAYEVLRIHSRQQIDRKVWERHYRAVKRAVNQTPITDDEAAKRPMPTIASEEASAKSGLPDGSRYVLLKDRLRLRLPYSKDKSVRSNVRLLEGKVPAWAYSRHKDPAEAWVNWVDILDGSVLLDVAAAVEPRHPKLAAIIRQHEPTWRARIGTLSKEARARAAKRTEGATLAESDRGDPMVLIAPRIDLRAITSAPGVRMTKTSKGAWGVRVRDDAERDRVLKALRAYPEASRYAAAVADIEALDLPKEEPIRARESRSDRGERMVVFSRYVPLKDVAADGRSRLARNTNRTWGVRVVDVSEALRVANALERKGHQQAATDVREMFGWDPL